MAQADINPVAATAPNTSDGAAIRTGALVQGNSLAAFFDRLEDSGCPRLVTLRRPGGTLASVRHSRNDAGRRGEWELLRLASDLFVITSDAACNHAESFPIAGEGLIEFHFRLSGRLSLWERGDENGPAIDVGRGSLLVWRQPAGQRVVGRIHAEEREASVTIYLRPSALERCFGDRLAALPPALFQSLCTDHGALFSQRLSLVPRLAQLVHELASSRLDGPTRLVRAEATVTLILCEVFDLLDDAARDVPVARRFTDGDVACLRRARAIIDSRHAPPPTVVALAREVGLGATKLKRGFKGLFGIPVSEYGHELRMRRALELLAKPDLSIARASEALGYEHQSSFTAAFHRRYAVLPKDYRRDPRLLGRSEDTASGKA